ncbi:hypothetical protein BU019_09390 [Staphylococcus simulans]|uniref:hypothetical protein n=1 Tax=Staphylococcus simulans TaxID=1286 RepID=UPI000D1E8CBE|nr:hypothetical protein [Staphylococcus simulans]PTI96128.1 hypothetical protein BU054_11845 [Staphylococcus simulans]PTJ50888.1 hypothetical protein BU019_09390 [Staphylococcus simulans]
MKQLRMIPTMTLSLLLLAACGTQSQEDKQTSKSSEQKTETKETNAKQDKVTSETKNNNQTNTSKESTENQKEEPQTQKGPLTEQEIKHNVALMILNPNFDQKYITGQEVLEGKYSGRTDDGKIHHFKVNEVHLIQPESEMKLIHAPTDMVYYIFDPRSGPYSVLVGISHEKVIVWGTQTYYADYNQEIENGFMKEYKVADLKKLNIPKSQIQAVESKIMIGNNEQQPIIRLD